MCPSFHRSPPPSLAPLPVPPVLLPLLQLLLLQETAWDLLIIAAIAQRQGGDLTWLEPYWPAIQTWCVGGWEGRYSNYTTVLPPILLPSPGTRSS